MGAKYKADKIEERADSCSTPMSTLKNGNEKLFQKYQVFFLTK